MPILNYTTQISSFKTVAEIQQILVKHGAKRIVQDYDENGAISARTARRATRYFVALWTCGLSQRKTEVNKELRKA